MQKQISIKVDYKCNSMKNLHPNNKKSFIINHHDIIINSLRKYSTPNIIYHPSYTHNNKFFINHLHLNNNHIHNTIQHPKFYQRQYQKNSTSQKKFLNPQKSFSKNIQYPQLKSKNINHQQKLSNYQQITHQHSLHNNYYQQPIKPLKKIKYQINSKPQNQQKYQYLPNYILKNHLYSFKIPQNQVHWATSSLHQQISHPNPKTQCNENPQHPPPQKKAQISKFPKFVNKKKLLSYNSLTTVKTITQQNLHPQTLPQKAPSPQQSTSNLKSSTSTHKIFKKQKKNTQTKYPNKIQSIPNIFKCQNHLEHQKHQKYLHKTKKHTHPILTHQPQYILPIQQFELGKTITLKTISLLPLINKFTIIKKITSDQKTSTFLVLQSISKSLYCLKKCQIDPTTINQQNCNTPLNKLQHLIRQSKIGQFITHPFLIKTYCTFVDSHNVYHLMQYIQGSTLYSQNRNNFYLKSQTSDPHSTSRLKPSFSKLISQMSNIKQILYQLLTALSYLHQRGIIHRDLKPANILITHKDTYKIGDFGSSILNNSSQSIGTLDYAAPQIMLRQSYNMSIDMWSLGCIAFQLYVGYPPFFNQNRDITITKTIGCDYQYFKIYDQDLSNLISKLLQINSQKRINAKQALQHSFFKEFKQI